MAEAAEENKAKFAAMNKSVFLLGYTGETGKVLLRELVDSKVFSKVVLIGRRQVEYEEEDLKNLEQKIVDFEKIDDYKEAFNGLDVGYCCLGTTAAKAGSSANFYRVDHDYIVNTAKVAKEAGCQQFHLLSSARASKGSFNHYLKTKAEAEDDVKTLEFEKLMIYRPGFLLCNREERRTKETVAKVLLKPVTHFFPTMLSIPTSTLAKAMLNGAFTPIDKPMETFENKALHHLSGIKK